MKLIKGLLTWRRAAHAEKRAPEREFIGHVDVLGANGVGGWAAEVNGNEVSIEILVNGVIRGTAPCRDDRHDVEEAGFKKQSGFHFDLSRVLDLSEENRIQVRIVGSDGFLPGPTLIERKFSREQMLQEGFALPNPLFVATAYSYEMEGEVIVVAGEIKTGGSEPTTIQVISGGILVSFEFYEVKASSFLCAFGIKVYSYSARFKLMGEACLQFEFSNPYQSDVRPICATPGIGGLSSFVPPDDSRKRVVGVMTPNNYLTLAYTSAALLWRIVGGEDRKGMWLDWGCGPGRTAIPLTRVFAKQWQIFGCDIDEYNINILKRLDRDIPAVVNELHPPLPYKEGTFDIVHGFSVLTHLTEDNQRLWVDELARILKPNGLAVLTTHGELALLMSGLIGSDSIYSIFIRHGISDEIIDGALGPSFRDKAYYRATFQTKAHARTLFERRFDVVRYIAGGYHNHQDLWVLIRR